MWWPIPLRYEIVRVMGANTKLIVVKVVEHWTAIGNQITERLQALRIRSFSWFAAVLDRARRWSQTHATKIELGFWLLAAIGATLSLPIFQASLTPLLNDKLMASVQTLALTVGAAMIGATAIASSFVLFAMQVNIERLPYGLFYRFSSDLRLLTAFAFSFAAAIGGTALSLIYDQNHVALIIVLELAAVILVLRLLLLAYRRSLHLVNPLQQLGIVYRLADHDLRRVDRHIRWTSRPSRNEEEGAMDNSRRAILDANPKWDRFLRDAIEHAVAFARRAGERGDLEISATALDVVVALNERYIQVKGRTFFVNKVLFDNPQVTDGTINATLESLRRLHEASLARRDEQQLEHIFRTYAALVQVYLRIEYRPGQSKSHALLATSYLEQAVEAAVPQNLVDTLMQGVRILGSVGRQFFMAGNSTEGVGCVSKIAFFGMVGAASAMHRPLTLVAMEQLRDLLFMLLRVKERDIGFAVRELRKSINEVANFFLERPDTPLALTNSTSLAPFFSSTSFNSFRDLLTNLVNALLEAEDAKVAELVADHLEIWADGLFNEQKKLLLLSIEKRSQFAFDMVHWITGITELLIATSRAHHTRDYTRGELEKHALWLFSTLTWIPTDKDTTSFIENLSFRSEVFETALRALRDDWPDGFDTAWKLSMKWAIEGGRNQTGWGTLERWLTALCALALRGDANRTDQLKDELTAQLQTVEAPSQELRDRAARDLREKAEQIRECEFELDSIERILASNNREPTQALLLDVANILSPGTAA